MLSALNRARQVATPRLNSELIIVQNRGTEISPAVLAHAASHTFIKEDRLGVAFARAAGIRVARGPLILFIDDDTIVADNYLIMGQRFAASNPDIGVFGGRIRGEFERTPEAWKRPLLSFLALRELEGEKKVASEDEPSFDVPGAGMFLRCEVAQEFARMVEAGLLSGVGRVGTALTSGDDTACCMISRRQGLGLAYVEGLGLTHVIPPCRLETDYLRRVAHDIGKSSARLDSIFYGADSLKIKSNLQIGWRYAAHVLRNGLRAGLISAGWHVGYRRQALAERDLSFRRGSNLAI